MLYDVVYFVKNADENEELRYSLRSLEANFPCGKVWFFGGCPAGLGPDVHVPVVQDQDSKYLRVRNMLRRACFNEEITPSFWLFNDDFFIMKRQHNPKPAIRGTLENRVAQLEKQFGLPRPYSNRLKATARVLRSRGCDTLDYELHIPFLVNRERAQKVLSTFSDDFAFRSIYGNYNYIGGEIRKDVKVFDLEEAPDETMDFLSTSDVSFRVGIVGEYIRKRFQKKSRWEK